MIKFFRHIRQNLIMENLSAEQAGKTGKPAFAKVTAGKYLKYAIGEIVLVSINKTVLCPVRDQTWVATNKDDLNPRAFRYEIYNVPNGTLNHRITNLLPI